MNKKLIVLFFFMFVTLIELHGNTYIHEYIHETIYKYNGCDNITVEVNLFDKSFTRCNEDMRNKISQEQYLDMKNQNTFNEIIGYTIPLLICIFNLNVYIISMLIIRND